MRAVATVWEAGYSTQYSHLVIVYLYSKSNLAVINHNDNDSNDNEDDTLKTTSATLRTFKHDVMYV